MVWKFVRRRQVSSVPSTRSYLLSASVGVRVGVVKVPPWGIDGRETTGDPLAWLGLAEAYKCLFSLDAYLKRLIPLRDDRL